MKITSKIQLIHHIASLKSTHEESMTLWSVYGGYKTVNKMEYDLDGIHIGSPIHDNTLLVNNEFLYHKTTYGFDYESLADRNLGDHSYNNNWWFTTEQEAKDYVNPTKNIVLNKNDIPLWMTFVLNKQKINAIKEIRGVFGCDLLTAKRFVEEFIEGLRNV